MSDGKALRPEVVDGKVVIVNKFDYDEVILSVDDTEIVLNNCYQKGRADAEKELQGVKDLGKLYSEIRADAIKEFTTWLSETLKVDKFLRESTENRWIEDFNAWLKNQKKEQTNV